jgi:hypothetical protein
LSGGAGPGPPPHYPIRHCVATFLTPLQGAVVTEVQAE